MKLAKKIAVVLVIAVIVVLISYFARVNDRNVTLDLVFYTVEDIQIWLLALFCFLAGLVFALIYFLFDILFFNFNEHKLKKENRQLKAEISRMRNSKLAEIESSKEDPSAQKDHDDSETGHDK